MLRLSLVSAHVTCLVALLMFSAFNYAARADEPAKPDAKAAEAKPAATPAAKTEQKFPEWSKVTEGAKQIDGLFTLYYNEKDQKLLMAIRRDQYNQEFMLPISIARGAGMMYLGGDTLNFGEQWILSFQRAADRILVVRRNVKFKGRRQARRRPTPSRFRTTTA